MLFSTGIRASTPDQKESSKTVAAFDVGKTAKVEIQSIFISVVSAENVTHENQNFREMEARSITLKNFSSPIQINYENNNQPDPDYHLRC